MSDILNGLMFRKISSGSHYDNISKYRHQQRNQPFQNWEGNVQFEHARDIV